jgi:hypothetical protein
MDSVTGRDLLPQDMWYRGRIALQLLVPSTRRPLGLSECRDVYFPTNVNMHCAVRLSALKRHCHGTWPMSKSHWSKWSRISVFQQSATNDRSNETAIRCNTVHFYFFSILVVGEHNIAFQRGESRPRFTETDYQLLVTRNQSGFSFMDSQVIILRETFYRYYQTSERDETMRQTVVSHEYVRSVELCGN